MRNDKNCHRLRNVVNASTVGVCGPRFGNHWGISYAFGTGWRWIDSFTPRPLYAEGKSSRYPLDRRLCEPSETILTLAGRQIFAPAANRTQNPPVSQPVAQLLCLWVSCALLYFISTETFQTRCTSPVLPIKLNFIYYCVVSFLLFSLSRILSFLLSCFLAVSVIR